MRRENLELSLTYTAVGRRRGGKVYKQISLRSWAHDKCYINALTLLFRSARVFRH